MHGGQLISKCSSTEKIIEVPNLRMSQTVLNMHCKVTKWPSQPRNEVNNSYMAAPRLLTADLALR